MVRFSMTPAPKPARFTLARRATRCLITPPVEVGRNQTAFGIGDRSTKTGIANTGLLRKARKGLVS
jgi:hypothetical protein